MRRPWHIALIFGASLLLLLAATGWITRTALRYERAEARVRAEAALEENVRLALWRLDSALAPLIAQENARPAQHYRSFYPAAAETKSKSPGPAARAPALIPSPLLSPPPAFVRIYFQLDSTGMLTSPQVPEDALLEALPPDATAEQIAAARRHLDDLRAWLDYGQLATRVPGPSSVPAAPRRSPAEVQQTPARTAAAQQQAEGQPAPQRAVQDPDPNDADQAPRAQQQRRAQSERNVQEFQARQQTLSQYGVPLDNTFARLPLGPTLEGSMEAFWQNGALLLARRVFSAGDEYIQGCWLDWDSLRRTLVPAIIDLLPYARLEAAPASATPTRRDPTEHDAGRLLAALPIRLVPGPSAALLDGPRLAVWLPLLAAWSCVLLATAAVGLVLFAAVRLSERRAAFVSAVTHELRTPLTTFRLYTEMLATDLVPDEEHRRSYLATLQAEALRLGHLVENVLAYARLERRAARTRVEPIRLADLLARVEDRLRARAAHSEMELVVERRAGAGRHMAAGWGSDATAGSDSETETGESRLTLLADPLAVEQILFNLVDNACKFAQNAPDRRIHLAIVPGPQEVEFHVCDHGPGIPPDIRRRLFRPFHKSAADAANSVPGVGLGLALSRKLARAVRGDLRLADALQAPANVDHADRGACFVLILPLAPSA